MSIYLEVTNGKYAASTVALEEGDVCRIGRGAGAEVCLPDDFELAESHFMLSFDGFSGKLFDLGSKNGTFLGTEKILAGDIDEHCQISAGETDFAVLLEEDLGTQKIETPINHFVGFLKEQKLPLYGLVDASREDKVLSLLRRSNSTFQSLYQGETQKQLGHVAPYLVRFNEDHLFLEKFLRHGWGKRWVSFFTSEAGFVDLRKHFRKFVFVKDEQGEVMYFRFYDPSILRTFLPPCNAEELSSFFGSIEAFFLESETPDKFFRFGFKDEKLLINKYKLTV